MSRRVVALLAMMAASGSASAGSEPVEFPGRDGLPIRGELFAPKGRGPFPGVVAMHGCNGLYERTGALNARHADWGERLSAAGFVVLMPDSFGSRGLGPQCRTAERSVRPSRERVDDAVAAKAFLQHSEIVKPEAISLLGWSNGGSTVLYTLASTRVRPSGPDFAKAVAFYPGCRVPQGRGWHTRIPLMILIGEADDWTPAAPCQELAAGARAQGEPVTLVTYPGAYHDFDHPGLAVHEVAGLAYTGGGGGTAHTGTDPAARADAIARVPAFLAR